nr:helix-turn-helix domain-containing protein [Saprospiraceae bacterium]
VNLPPSKVGQDFNVTDLLLMEGGQCWITTTSGLISYHLHSEKSQVYTCSLGPTVSYNSFTSVCSIGERLYLGTASMGIVEFDRMSHTFSSGIAIDNRLILNLASDGEKFVYAGTNGGGVKIIDVVTGTVENVIARQSKPESLSSNSIYALLLDGDGRFWVGTYSAGLCFSNIVEGSFKVFDLSADHPDINKSIRSFYFDSNGSKYYGTRNGFAATSANGVFNFFQSSHTESLKSNIILSIYPYEAHLLIGTYGGGVSQYSLAEPSMTPFLAHTPLSQGNIYDFAQDSTGALWITSFEGLFRYSPQNNELINFNTQNSTLINDQLFAITFDSKERLWVGSMAGVQALEWGEQGLIPIDLSVIPDNRFKTNYVYEDRDAQIWICTERGGLIQLDPDLTKSTQYRRKDGLPDNSICTIVEDQEGNYWISTLKGLCRFSPAAKAFVKYSMADGIPGLVFTPAASYLQEDGTIYLGNEKGLVHFKPADLDEANSAAKIMITDFYLSGKEVLPQEGTVLTSVMEETQEIRLATQKNDIGFRFISLNYINASNNRYQYKLEGLDQEWKDNGSNNTVFFEDLEAGNYTFRVRNSNDSGLAAANEAQVKIFIRASFFTSSLFYALLLGTVLFGGIVLIRHIQSLPHKIKKKIDHSKSTQKYNGSRISLDRSDAIITELRRQMKEEKLYLNPNLKLLDISNQINYPMNEISQVLNQHLNQNFPDFINKYRVEEVKNLMSQEEFQRFTLVAIAQQCGFNSKTSFYRIFKKETGQTPADYLREYWQRLEKT